LPNTIVEMESIYHYNNESDAEMRRFCFSFSRAWGRVARALQLFWDFKVGDFDLLILGR